MKLPSYEKVIQWVSGPVSALVGWGATVLVDKGWLPLADKAPVAKDVSEAVVFGIGAGITWLAHNKWLDGKLKWAELEERKIEAQIYASQHQAPAAEAPLKTTVA